jgi:hypothetical protein
LSFIIPNFVHIVIVEAVLMVLHKKNADRFMTDRRSCLVTEEGG